jgi:hypothetical protein
MSRFNDEKPTTYHLVKLEFGYTNTEDPRNFKNLQPGQQPPIITNMNSSFYEQGLSFENCIDALEARFLDFIRMLRMGPPRVES